MGNNIAAQETNLKSLTIAIDGPAASGKSTLAKALADHFDYLYFDTGVLYRAVTLAALQRNISVNDGKAVAALAQQLTIDVNPASRQDGRFYDVILDGEDCTWAIRSSEVDANVSEVSAYPGVRAALKEQQRRIGLRGGVVMAGRDIGTVVLPEAELKIYLDASVEERAHRRHAEMIARGEESNLSEVEESMRHRDEIDANRSIAPLRPASDAIKVTSNGKQPDEVLAEVVQLVREKQTELSSEA